MSQSGEPTVPILTEFSDRRLVAVYDLVNAYEPGTQPQFYGQLAAETGAGSIVDLGCGTGLITCELAGRGYRMTGVDPAPAMIEQARRRAHGGQVHWICGDARDLGRPDADLAFMSGHVAQFFLTDQGWQTAVESIHAALVAGGHLAFESRNPTACEWETWTSDRRFSVHDPVAGRIETWSEVDEVREGLVSYANHFLFTESGEDVVAPCQLRFRSLDELCGSLADAGFAIDVVYGDWQRGPVEPAAPELIVVASR